MCRMTQSELAAVLGVTERTLRDWENGVTVPDQEKQKRVMDALARLDGTAYVAAGLCAHPFPNNGRPACY